MATLVTALRGDPGERALRALADLGARTMRDPVFAEIARTALAALLESAAARSVLVDPTSNARLVRAIDSSLVDFGASHLGFVRALDRLFGSLLDVLVDKATRARLERLRTFYARLDPRQREALEAAVRAANGIVDAEARAALKGLVEPDPKGGAREWGYAPAKMVEFVDRLLAPHGGTVGGLLEAFVRAYVRSRRYGLADLVSLVGPAKETFGPLGIDVPFALGALARILERSLAVVRVRGGDRV